MGPRPAAPDASHELAGGEGVGLPECTRERSDSLCPASWDDVVASAMPIAPARIVTAAGKPISHVRVRGKLIMSSSRVCRRAPAKLCTAEHAGRLHERVKYRHGNFARPDRLRSLSVGAGRPRGGEVLSPEEFTAFYAASFGRLVGQLYAMTGDQAEAQDAVQEAFVRAWAHRGRLDADGSPEAWVRSTAWRVAVSRWHRARMGRFLIGSQPPQAADEPGPDRIALIDALRRLPAEQRRAVVLYHLCDRSVAEIAAETGAPVGTVKARLARGRAALAPYLRETATSLGSHHGERG